MATPAPPERGTMACYKTGCDHPECRAENARASQLRRDRIAAGIKLHVDGDMVRERLRLLTDPNGANMSLSAIGKQCGVPRGDLSRILKGRPQHGIPPQRKVTNETWAKIDSVPTPEKPHPDIREPAGPISTLIQELMLRQYSIPDIASGSGLARDTIRKALWLRESSVMAATAEAIRKFDVENLEPGPSPDIAKQAWAMGFPLTPVELRRLVGREPAGPTMRRLRLMATQGWPIEVLVEDTGLGRNTLLEIRRGERETIERTIAKMVLHSYGIRSGIAGPSRKSEIRADRSWDDLSTVRPRHERILVRPIAQTSQQLYELGLMGWPMGTIAEYVKTTAATLGRVLCGRQDTILEPIALAVDAFYRAHINLRGPSREIARMTANRGGTVEMRAKTSLKYDATDIKFMLRDLMLRRWPMVRISQITGVSRISLDGARLGKITTMVGYTALPTRRFFFEHRMIDGPSDSPQVAGLARASGYLPIWRVRPDLAFRPPLMISNTRLSGLELRLEEVVRDWLYAQSREPEWSAIDAQDRTFLERRFRLSSAYHARQPLSPIGDFSRIVGLSPAQARATEKRAILSLLRNPDVSVQRFENELRTYVLLPVPEAA